MLLGQIKYSPLGDFVRDKDGVQLTTRLTGDNKNPSMGSRAGEAASLLSPGNPSSPSLLCLLVVIVGGWKQLIRTSKARAGQFLIISVSSHCSLLTHPDK